MDETPEERALAIGGLACHLVIAIRENTPEEVQGLITAVHRSSGVDGLAQLAYETAKIAAEAFDRSLDREVWQGALRDQAIRLELLGDLEEFDRTGGEDLGTD
ncbi:hypothetical protein DEI93_03280 [Curtobacterium sp. MCBD17_035]|uniref:hypothetical protein n=1 Tax=Curtobacterium sp. MCBD17_035 TaxID=2175673 RepID=UPI000DA77700|nr:hypothetical protein [Curtobacterium sp. MCBD17_035]WIB68080.1 hypothetical protein DEI93_03280 [Curtobacterium sp. MCBD17_035]